MPELLICFEQPLHHCFFVNILSDTLFCFCKGNFGVRQKIQLNNDDRNTTPLCIWLLMKPNLFLNGEHTKYLFALFSFSEGTFELTPYSRTGSSSNSGSEVGVRGCDSNYGNNGSLESIDDSQSASSAESSELQPLRVTHRAVPLWY